MLDQDITLADQIFTRMRREIVEGQLPPGSKMSEPELARRYGISRGPLREALRRLESSSLVVRRPNVGARVVELTSDQLLDLYYLREALEGLDWALDVYERCSALMAMPPAEEERAFREGLLDTLNRLIGLMEEKRHLQMALILRQELLPSLDTLARMLGKVSQPHIRTE